MVVHIFFYISYILCQYLLDIGQFWNHKILLESFSSLLPVHNHLFQPVSESE